MSETSARAGLQKFFITIIAVIGISSDLLFAQRSNTSVAPIERLWWIVAEAVTQRNIDVVRNAITQWREVGTFDAFSIGILPLTFTNLDTSIMLANQLHEQVLGRLIVGVFPTGTEGWETSFNRQFAQRLDPLGVVYDSTKAMTREAWLENLRALEASTWAYVLEQPARRPTAEEVQESVSAFVHHALGQNKNAVLWLSAMMCRQPADVDIARRIWAAVGDQVEAVVWMDLPIVSQDPGRSLEGLLDTILSLTSPQKVMIQWTHNPNLITKDTEGTLEYIATCQAKGINRFVLLANPWLMRQEPWATFYRSLRKATSVEWNEVLSKSCILHQNYPNPFNSSTTIRFSLPERSHVILKIFDVLGREVATLVEGELSAGEHSVLFTGEGIPGGVYIVQMSANAVVRRLAIVLAK